jgi:hypothetical protein
LEAASQAAFLRHTPDLLFLSEQVQAATWFPPHHQPALLLVTLCGTYLQKLLELGAKRTIQMPGK